MAITTKQMGEDCYKTVRSYTASCKKKAYDRSQKACAKYTGIPRGNCMEAAIRANINSGCASLIKDCANKKAKSVCNVSQCIPNVEKEVISWAAGKDPKPKAKPKPAPKTQAEADMYAVLEKEATLNLPVNMQVAPVKKSGPLGVPLWAWIGGGVAAAYVVLRK